MTSRSPGLSNDRATAIEFAGSLRGQYIVSKALAEAIEVLKQLKGIEAAPSDLADMEYLYENLFNLAVSRSTDSEGLRRFIYDGDSEQLIN
tara:strand:+ start:698 stop:970 length:273 start_codon:yes stop_codon:yes gene_type:complete